MRIQERWFKILSAQRKLGHKGWRQEMYWQIGTLWGQRRSGVIAVGRFEYPRSNISCGALKLIYKRADRGAGRSGRISSLSGPACNSLDINKFNARVKVEHSTGLNKSKRQRGRIQIGFVPALWTCTLFSALGVSLALSIVVAVLRGHETWFSKGVESLRLPRSKDKQE